MRTLHELYCILWEEIKNDEHISSICLDIRFLYYQNIITVDEWELLKSHFKSQKPSATQHTDFTEHPNWRGGAYWWNDDEDHNPTERKRFVKLQMELTK